MKNSILEKFSATRDQVKERLEVLPAWFPIPVLLSFGLVLVIGAHTASVTNPKRGYTGSLITLAAERGHSSSIWLGVTIKDEHIAIMTEEQSSITLPRVLNEEEDLNPLVEYLNKRVKERIDKIALSRRAAIDDVSVVIAVDESMRYAHVRPLLQALAEAKITHYAFETLQPLKVATTDASQHHE